MNVVVAGAGIAGLTAALRAHEDGHRVTIVIEDALGGGCTPLAQGGVAGVYGPGDSAALHAEDTLLAGGGLCDPDAVDVLVADGPARIAELIARGVAFDRDADGMLMLGREAAHRCARIVHAGGDATGAAISAALVARVDETPIEVIAHALLVDLLHDGGRVHGIRVLRGDALVDLHADAVILATGGAGRLYAHTTNPVGATGDGIAAALRAGVAVADLEFVQFHPTVLAGTGELVSEAVRGAGAVLRDGSGRRFMQGADPRAELAPRDVVSRAVHRTLRERGEVSVWLDARGIEAAEGPGALAKRFPGISAMLARHGFDWAREAIPVAPAAHYSMGGVASDLDGRSTLPGLLVAGEVSSTGVHGANRLASNSLLEGVVFGGRAGRAAAAWVRAGRARWELRGTGIEALAADATPVRLASQADEPLAPDREAHERDAVGAALENGLGIERDAHGLGAAQEALRHRTGPAAELAAMLVLAAAERTESRGAHQRADHPGSDPVQARRRAFRFARADASGAASTADTAASAATRSIQGSLTPC